MAASEAAKIPDTLVGKILADIKYYAIAIGVAVAAIAGIWTAFKEGFDDWPYSPEVTMALAAIGVVIICFGIIVPRWREKRRIARMIPIGENFTALEASRFRIEPRSTKDFDDFDRADRAHEKALAWIKDATAPVLYLTGRSGVGKTSLLSAFVIPALKGAETALCVVEARSYADPIQSLISALRTPGVVWETPPDIVDARPLLEAAARYCAPSRLLIVMDQFEEFMILGNDATRATVASFLLDLQENPIAGAQILLSSRSDREFLAALQDTCPTGMTLNETWFVVDGFALSEARMFLTPPGVAVSEDMLDAMLTEAVDVEEKATRIRPIVLNLLGLVLMHFAGGELRSSKPGQFIRGFLLNAILSPDCRVDAPRILACMITDGGTKRPMTEQAISDRTGILPGMVRSCLSLLNKEGLTREIDRQSRTWEISHDFAARVISQTLPAIRPSFFRRTRALWAPVALFLWIITVAAGVPFYIGYQKDQIVREIRKYGTHMVQQENSGVWNVKIGYGVGPGSGTISETERVLSMLERFQYPIELSIADQDFNNLPLSDLLSNIPQLTALAVMSNDGLTALTIPQLDALTSLVVYRNDGLTALTIPQLDALTYLEVSGNDGLTALTIPQLDALTSLKVSLNDGLTALTIPQLDALTSLQVIGNDGLPALTILQLDALTTLTVSNNDGLTALTIPQLDALTSLVVRSNNGLTALTIPQLDALTSLEVNGNDGLTALTIPQLDALTYLEVSGNDGLPALTIPQLDALTSLKVSLNDGLTALTIPQLDALTSLEVYRNDGLPALTIPQLHALTTLIVRNNFALTALTIPQLDALTTLTVRDNVMLTALTVPNLDRVPEVVIERNHPDMVITQE